MPLTGKDIAREFAAGRIHITPYDATRLSATTYRVRLADDIVTYTTTTLDAQQPPRASTHAIPATGLLLEPGRIYLARTMETIGSPHFAMTLEAEPAVSSLGLWIEFSAPLGHVGARIPWTLELAVVHPIVIYPGMPIGKVAFWEPIGALAHYRGRYADSVGIVTSKLAEG
ncbi:MAG: deoxycytidine triphosphate deaminase [Ktedonobacterales bacterium]|nr:deoxycytidine triphosphate deaminase [Ktedonobacterales bacterium]